MTLYTLQNLAYLLLSLASLGVIGFFLFLYLRRRNKLRRWHCLFPALAVLVLAWCIRVLYVNYVIYDLYNKVVRPPQSCYVEDLRLTPRECIEDFREITAIVSRYYEPLARHKGIDLGQLHAMYRDKVVHVRDAREYALLLVNYFASLENGHTHLFFYDYRPGIKVKMRNDSLYVIACMDKALPLEPRDVIVAVGGIPTAQCIEQQMSRASASTDAARRQEAAVQVLRLYTDSCLEVTVQREDSLFNTTLPLYNKAERMDRLKRLMEGKDSLRFTPRKEIALTDLPQSLATVLREDSIGFIKIDHFQNGSAERFRQDYLACRHLPYLILNLEDNGGGLQENVNDIAACLVDRDVLLENIPVRCDSALRYTGKLFVLMNTFTASAAECLVACLKGQPNVTVIGQRSAGDCGSWAYNFRTRHGLEFKLATRPPFFLPDGKTLSEGMGITPDMETRVSLPWEKEESLAQALFLIGCDKRENTEK